MTHVKVCGLTRQADVNAAVAHGAWALGFILWARSPRAVSASQIRQLTSEVPAGIKRVGVVVDGKPEEVQTLMKSADLTTIQLHGNEDVAPFLSLGIDVIKAVSLVSDTDVDHAAALPAAVTVLVDAHDPVRRGGTGVRADWGLAAALAKRRPILLAGGLRAENVADAISQVAPFGLDVSSGLETAPGIKDVERMQDFFAMLGDGKVGK